MNKKHNNHNKQRGSIGLILGMSFLTSFLILLYLLTRFFYTLHNIKSFFSYGIIIGILNDTIGVVSVVRESMTKLIKLNRPAQSTIKYRTM